MFNRHSIPFADTTQMSIEEIGTMILQKMQIRRELGVNQKGYRVTGTTHRNLGFVSLGCPKALVDSERILSQLRAEDYAICDSYQGC
ncbi:MAG: hypothetical protein Ct9H300mP16_14170 [Pseudomonadota bacterium]|nr:MAG: hypothetical protein Ct9H300mP16_14170 [Pseudomonadota bacterium]